MAQSAEQQWQFAQRVQRELEALVKHKDSIYEDVEHLIHQFRIACETTIFLNFDYATLHKVHNHLWDAHLSINSRYRKILTGCKSATERKKVVERRKWEKRYVDFLKTSQFFYKGHIQRLASHFAGLAELRKIAHRLKIDTLSADDRIRVSAETEQRILLSCHTTLICLGDLSRYRNATRVKDRSWDTAMAYYELANDLYPNSGNAFHQMAVISLGEGDHLNAIYQLYRALAIEEPNAAAEGNLEIEFKKIAKGPISAGKKQVAERSDSNGTAGNAAHLVSWFAHLHAKIYKGEDFPSHQELENEVLGQMAMLLKRQSLEGILDKIVLINIASQFFAHQRLQGATAPAAKEDCLRSFYFCLRLNIRTFIALLQLLESELFGPINDDDAPDVTGRGKDNNTENITAVTRRLLPALRQYSTWLVSNVEIGNIKHSDATPYIHIRDLWSTYCSTLSLLVVTFPPENLQEINYLLEEDASTVGMKPFRDSKRCELYITAEGRLKPRITDPGVERSHPNLEMLSRVRDLLRDGMVLSNISAPIRVDGIKFQFVEDGLPTGPSSSQPTQSSHTPVIVQSMETSHISGLQDNDVDRPASFARSDSPQSMSTDMYRMVDDLVTPTVGQQKSPQGSNETSYGVHNRTADEVFAALDIDGRPASRQTHSPTPFPRLPGIYNSPFSPQPGELSTITSDRSDAGGRLSSLHLSTTQQQRDAANALGQTTGYISGQRLSRETNLSSSRLATSKPLQTINHIIQQSLVEQFNPSSSATFSHTSSLYLGTPMRIHAAGQPYSEYSNNTSTSYGGMPDFQVDQMLQSSIWNGSQPAWASGSAPTPPNGQS